MTDTFGTVARQIPLDPTIMDINMVMVLDYPEYTQGLLARLPDTVRNPAILKELSERHQGMADGYDQHPLEIDIQEEDIRKLAYELFLARLQSGAPGDDRQDWYEAERQLKMQATRVRAR